MHDDDFTKGSRGEYRGDFTRDTFDPLRRFSGVLMQQGRVQTDADWNEQSSIYQNYLRKLGIDLMGPHCAPRDQDGRIGEGFKIIASGATFNIGSGHYYVNGILCENELDNIGKEQLYTEQPDYPLIDEEKKLEEGEYLVYLDVWERHISYVEDDYIREKALGGADTATRAQIVWQVKVVDQKEFVDADARDTDPPDFKLNYQVFLAALEKAGGKTPGSGQLKARARISEDDKAPCLTSPEAQYRGVENQLYRVEVHTGGTVNKEDNTASEGEDVSFKWSRENGSVIFPVIEIHEDKITLEYLGRDSRFGLKPNDWVEIVDDDYILRNRANRLLQVKDIDPENMQITLKESQQSGVLVGADVDKHPYLRRWDQKNGNENGVSFMTGSSDEDWFSLEEGIEVQFLMKTSEGKIRYQTGDYWLIPARTATGDVEWPGSRDAPTALEAQGVDHHYAPLCHITVDRNGNVEKGTDLRRKLKKNWD